MPTVLFLCTGNYYRSRFAELYFRHLAATVQLQWRAASRGLELHPENQGSMSPHAVEACRRWGIATDPMRMPMALEQADLERADLAIALKESEHRPLIEKTFFGWQKQVCYWEIHDLDVACPEQTLARIRDHVTALVEGMQRRILLT